MIKIIPKYSFLFVLLTFLMASYDDLNESAGRLKEMTPLPMNSMLDRGSKADALKQS